MSVKKTSNEVIITIPTTPAYSSGWMLDALANGAHKGLMMAKKGLAAFQSEGFQILDGKHPVYIDPNSEQSQARLGQLDEWIDERQEQIFDFESVRDLAASHYYNIKGSKWLPYEAKSDTLKTKRSKTAVNASWAKRAKENAA